MGNLGFGELLLIFLVIMLVFGSSKLPQLGDALGKGIRNFKKASAEDDSIDVTPKKELPPQQQAAAAPQQQAAAAPASTEKK